MRRIRTSSSTIVLFLSVLFWFQSGLFTSARCEDLEGRLFLGEGLSINLAEKESAFQEFLRYLNLKSSPRKLTNISELGDNGDRVFIGEDMKLYFTGENQSSGAYCIGEARKLWKFKLDKDVGLAKVKTVGDLFTSGDKGRLKLRVKTANKRPKASEVRQATFKFWLEELVFEYDSYSPGNSTDENYPYICSAIKSALPSNAEDADEKSENLSYLKDYVHDVAGMDLIPLRSLLDELIEELESSTLPPAMKKDYEEISSAVIKKTEGL